LRDFLHRARAARRGRRLAFLGAFAAVHFGFAVHTAARSAVGTHRTILHGASTCLGTHVGAATHRTVLHGAGASASTSLGTHGTARRSSGRRSLGKSSGAYEKGTSSGQEQFGGLHGNIKLKWSGELHLLVKQSEPCTAVLT
jgi:hypothetical protein